MKKIKKYLKEIFIFFVRIFNRKRSILLKYKSNFILKEETETRLKAIAEKNIGEGNEELKLIVQETTRQEIFEIISNSSKYQISSVEDDQINLLMFKLTKINSDYFNLEINKRRIYKIEYFINENLTGKIAQLNYHLNKNGHNSIPYSAKSINHIRNRNSLFEKTDSEDSTLLLFKNRELDKLKMIEQQKKYIKIKFADISNCINSNEYSQAKLHIHELEHKINESKFHREYKQLIGFKKKLAEREENHNKKIQDELLQQQVERILQLEIEKQKKKKEEEHSFKYVSDSEKDMLLDKYKIDYLYHMTDISNLPNILKYGLLSHHDAHSNELNISDISMREVNDKRANKKPIYGLSLHSYVPTYFNPKNTMLYVRRNMQNIIVIIAIDRRAIYQEKSIFTDGNATSRQTKFYNSLIGLNELNWQCIKNEYWGDFEDGRRIKCAETLVYPKINVFNFMKIYCYDIKAKREVERCLPENINFRVELNSKYYF